MTCEQAKWKEEDGNMGDRIIRCTVCGAHLGAVCTGKRAVAPVYKPGTTLEQIIRDGWSRDFKAEQTHSEAVANGYEVTLECVKRWWEEFNVEYYRKTNK